MRVDQEFLDAVEAAPAADACPVHADLIHGPFPLWLALTRGDGGFRQRRLATARCRQPRSIGTLPAGARSMWSEFRAAKRLSGNLERLKGSGMNWDRIEGNWKQFTGKVKEKWGKLTDDDMAQINGNREQLEGLIQSRYGYAKDQVRKDVDDWLNRQ
jgi:uncharacterized protein YjbJ (UPF0337 family)